MSVPNTNNAANQHSPPPDPPDEISWTTYRHWLAQIMVHNHPRYPASLVPELPSREPSGLALLSINNNRDSHLTPLGGPIPGQLLHTSVSIQKNKLANKPIRNGLNLIRFDTMMSRVDDWKTSMEEIKSEFMDNGTEDCMETWFYSEVLPNVLEFLKFHFIGELQFQSAQLEDSVDNQALIDKIIAVSFYKLTANPKRTAVDKLVAIKSKDGRTYDVVSLIEFKRWSLAVEPITKPVVQQIDDAVQTEKILLEAEWGESTTAHATVAQVFEQLAGPREEYQLSEGTKLLLTGVYGFHYEVTYCHQAKALRWSQNLSSKNLKNATTNEDLRSDLSVNEEILDLFFNALLEDLKKAIARWRNSMLIPVLPTVPCRMLPGFNVPQWVTFPSVVLSDVMDPLKVEINWPRLPSGPLYLNFQLLWIGNNVVWHDVEQGIVFKQYFTADTFNSELGFYRRLSALSWIPTVLATVSTLGRWGIFTAFAGHSLYNEDEWDEAVPTIEGWVKVLHSLGIHHHDIAPRNVLKGPDGSLTLLDFDRAVESTECDLSECPDLDLEYFCG